MLIGIAQPISTEVHSYILPLNVRTININS